MSLFGDLSGIFNSFEGTQSAQIAGPLMSALQENGVNGVGDLASKFEESGFGSHIASWIGNGENLPIDAATVEQVLGQPVIANLAAKLGIDPQQASALIAQHLPGVVNQVTPDGEVSS